MTPTPTPLPAEPDTSPKRKRGSTPQLPRLRFGLVSRPLLSAASMTRCDGSPRLRFGLVYGSPRLRFVRRGDRSIFRPTVCGRNVPSRRKMDQSPRRGMTLLELAVACTLLGTLLVVCLQLLLATAAQRRAADQRQLALVEVGNVMERVAARRWDDLTSKTLDGGKPSGWLGERLPGAELKIEVTAPSGEPIAKRITVSLRWQDRNGRYLPGVKIVTWRYREKDKG
jgi:hypothetical protein